VTKERIHDQTTRVIEALIFASDVPITAAQLHQYCEEAAPSKIRKAVNALNLEYTQQDRSFHIIEVAGGYQMVTREAYASWIRKLFHKRLRSRLTQAALETLSVIAFRQPVSRPEIAAIRGVNCDAVIKTLLERKLITLSGRGEGPGKPLLYKTTREFLRYFGINSIQDLPRPREIEELLKEDEDRPDDAIE